MNRTLSDDVDVFGLLESNLPLSNDVNTIRLGENGESVADNANWSIRHADIRFRHKDWGQLFIGQGDTASNGKSEMNLSLTSELSDPQQDVDIGNLIFYDKAANAYSGITAGPVYNSIDGAGRRDRVRYDMPPFNGFKMGASLTHGGAWDIGAEYNAAVGPLEVLAGAGYFRSSAVDSQVEAVATTSIAVRHVSGLNAEFAFGRQFIKSGQRDRRGKYFHGGLGYIADWTDLGPTVLQVVYGNFKDFSNSGDVGEGKSLIVLQYLDAAYSTVFAYVRELSLEQDPRFGTDLEDIRVAVAGVALRF